MTALLTALVALRSTIDTKVQFVINEPKPGSNAWTTVGFNDYCYESLKGSSGTESRTRAMMDLMGKASVLLAKDDPTGQLSVRSFYKNGKGENVPRLHISVRPATTANVPAMDPNAELAVWVEKAVIAGVDFSAIPAAITGVPAAYVGFLKAAVTRANTAAAVTETAQAGNTGNLSTNQTEDPLF